MNAEQAILARANPFHDQVVHSAWDPVEDDVPAIHAPVRKALEEAVAGVALDHGPRGVLLIGAAGAGKTHLLGWLRESLGERAYFACVTPFRDPRRVFRHILQVAVGDLSRRKTPREPRQLEALVEALLRDLHRSDRVAASFAAFKDELGRSAEHAAAVHRSAVRFLANRNIDIDRNVLRALLALAVPERADAAAAWLRGEALEGERLHSLGVAVPLIASGAAPAVAEDRAREVLAEIGLLSVLFRPIVLCFDQNESLGDAPHLKGMDALTKAICLLHGATNFLLVTTVEASTWTHRVEKSMLASHRARVAEEEHILRGIRGADAAAVVAARMSRLWPAAARPPVPTFPFRDEFFALVDVGREDVRSVLARCAQEVDRMKAAGEVLPVGAKSAAHPVAETLEQAVSAFWDSALRAAQRTPRRLEDDELREILRRLLEAAARRQRPLGGLHVEMAGRSSEPGIDVGFQCGERGLDGLAVRNEAGEAALAAALAAQARAVEEGRFRRVLTVRRGGLEPGLAAAAAAEARLRALGGGVLDLDRRSEALLASAARLVSGAVEGDLSCAGARATPEEAIDAAVTLGKLDDLPLFAALSSEPRPHKKGGVAAAPHAWLAAAASEAAAAADREELRRGFAALIQDLGIANLGVVLELLRRSFPAADREIILEAGRELREKNALTILQPAGGTQPVYTAVGA